MNTVIPTPMQTVPPIAFLKFVSSFAPKYFAMTMPNPQTIPLRNSVSKSLRDAVEPTAARDVCPIVPPIIRVSMRL